MVFKTISYRKIADVEVKVREIAAETEKSIAFIVPGSADREWLKDILLKDFAFGSELFRIWRWDELYREILLSQDDVSGLVQIDPPDHWLILHHLVSSLIKTEEGLLPGVRQSGFVDILGRTVRELIREDLGPASIRASLFPDGEGDKNDPGWVLCDLYEKYQSSLDEGKLMDSAAISAQTENLLSLAESGFEWLRRWHIVFVGFYSFTHSQLRLVRSMVDMGVATSLFTPLAGLAGEYSALSQLQGGSVESIASGPLNMVRMTGGTVRQEIEVLARYLILWSRGEDFLCGHGNFPGWENIGAGISSQAMSLVTEVFSRYRIPFNYMEGRNVSETSLWEAMRRIWDCYRDGWQPEPVAELLSLPWFDGDVDERDLLKAAPRGLKSWRGYLASREGRVKTAEALERCVAFAELIARGGAAEGLLRGVISLVTAEPDWRIVLSRMVDNRPDLDVMVLETGSALQEVDRKIKRIEEVERDIGEAGQKVLKGGDALTFLSVWAESATIWPGASRDGCLSLYVGTPPVLTRHKVWVMTDCTARSWPGKLAESPLLEDARKEKLHELDLKGDHLDRTHLPLLSEKRRQREVLFRRLLACGDELVIMTSSTMDGAGKVLPESPFIEKALEDGWIVEVDRIDRTPGQLLPNWFEPVIEPVEVHEPPQGVVSKRSERILSDKPVHDGSSPTVRLSSIDEFASCPYRFKCSQILRLSPPDQPGFNPRLSGTACHEVWRAAWQGYMDGSGSLTEMVKANWEPVLEECYRDLLKDRDLARRRDLVYDNMVQTALYLQGLDDGGLRNNRERSYLELSLPPLTIGGVSFSGIADRVDLMKDGSVIVWDYKSSLSSNYRNSLQLACYAILMNSGLDDMAFDMTYTAGYGFIGQSDRAIAGVAVDILRPLMGLSTRSRTSLDDRIDKADFLLNQVSKAFSEGRFDPNYDGPACRGCPYSGLCRISELHYREEDEDDKETGA